MSSSPIQWDGPKDPWVRLSIVQRHKYRGVMTWYLRENNHGHIVYRSLGTTQKSVAQQCLQRLLVLRFAFPWEKTVSMDIVTMQKRFCERPSLKEDSAEQYRIVLSHFSGWCTNRGISDALKFSIEDAQAYYSELSGKSARHRCRMCGVFLNWVYKHCKIEKVQPFKLIEYRKVVHPIRDSWSSDEIRRIVETAPDKDMRMLWALMAYAGLRINEATNLTDGNIRDNAIFIIGKGDKSAVLPIGKRLADEMNLHGPLGDGLHISKQRSIRSLCRVCKKLHIDGWASNHKFRHSFATNLAAHGCPVPIAMRLMRHSSSAMTLDVYTHVLQRDLVEWIDC